MPVSEGRCCNNSVKASRPPAEALLLAMAFAEYSENIANAPKLQVFATDLSDALLEKARRGLYPEELETSKEELESTNEE